MKEPEAVPPGAATIYDVARLAGVSISTVSLALNAPNRVRPSTLARVHDVVRELDYVPKAEAAVRARKGTRRVGVVGRFGAAPASRERLTGLLAAAGGDGDEVVIYDHGSAAFHVHLVESLSLAHKLDGLILVDVPIAESLAARLAADRFPTVLIEYARPGLSSVGIDNHAGGRLAARHLVARGHRRCAFVGLALENETWLDFPALDEVRLEGFRAGLTESGVDLPERYVRRAPIPLAGPDPEDTVIEREVRRAAHALLDLDPPPAAIFANFDILAAVVLAVARERGLRVPGDLAVIGFDDRDFAAPLGLTTVRQHLAESGRVAYGLLRDARDTQGRKVARMVTLPLEVVARDTA